MKTNVKIQVQEMFQFSYFSSKLYLVERFNYVGGWCQDLEIFYSLGFVDLGAAMHSLNPQRMTSAKI